MKNLKLIIGVLIVLAAALAISVYGVSFLKNSNSILQIETPNVKSTVFLNEKSLGETPLLAEKLREGEYSLLLEGTINTPSEKKVTFSKNIVLSPQTLTAVNYDFGPLQKFSAGDIRSLSIGEGLLVTTQPEEAEVWLDGEKVGIGPISISPNTGIHKLKVEKSGFYSREIDININSGKRLIVEVFLSINPFDKAEKIQDGVVVLYDLSSDRDILTTDSTSWAEGVLFYEEVAKLSFDSLIDINGRQYFKSKEAWDKKIKGGKKVFVGYLGNSKDSGLSQNATELLASFSKTKPKKEEEKQSTKQVQIQATPTGTLNVRKGPGLSYNIIKKVSPGEKYIFAEEKSSWYKIKFSSGSGWISSQYAKKL